MFFKVFRYSRIKNGLTPLTPIFLLLIAALFIAPFFTASLYANQNWQKASELNQKGDRLIAQNRFDEALQAFAEAERLGCDSGFYATRQGNVYLWHKKDPAAALQHYDRALTQGGNRSVFTLRERGIAFCQIERYDDSEKAFQSALQLAEQNLAAVPAHQAKERTGALDEVLYTPGYASICKRDQKRYTEAVARIMTGNRRQAKALAEQAHELYWNRKQHKAALEAAEKALARNPYQRDALLLAGLAAGDLKKNELAAAYLQRLAPIHPELWVLQRPACIQQWQLKDLPAAIRTFELIAERHPEESDRYPNYGRALMDADRPDEALAVFEQGRTSSKEDVAAQSAFWKGYLLGERMNRPSDALPLVQEGYNRGYRDSFVGFFLKKYPGSAVSERALAPDAPVTSPKTQRPVEAAASPMACSHSGD